MPGKKIVADFVGRVDFTVMHFDVSEQVFKKIQAAVEGLVGYIFAMTFMRLTA